MSSIAKVLFLLINVIEMSLEKQNVIEENFRKLFTEESFREHMSDEEFRRFNASTERMHFQKGEILFGEQEAPKHVFFINSGTAKLSKLGAYGKEQILRFIPEGDIAGYRSLLCGENFQAKAEAMTDVTATRIPAEQFMSLLENDVRFTFAMLQKFAFELGESSNTITFLAQKTVRERLAEVLVLLEQKLGTDPEGFINISLTREEIANLIGTATESAIRLISEFKQDKLIETEGRNIRILNHDKLRKVAHVQL